MKHAHNFNDLTGKRFGRLLVVGYAGKNKHGQTQWLVKCDCGKENTLPNASLTAGRTRSCGCLLVETSIRRATTHGRGNTANPEYACWSNMRQRCLTPGATNYKDYGGRGIKVCDRWLNSFENFIADMGMPPTPKHQIERRDNNGNYEPSNCYWATRKEQANNQRSTVILTLNGESKTISQWAEKSGLGYRTFYQRVTRYGYSLERALTTPLWGKRI